MAKKKKNTRIKVRDPSFHKAINRKAGAHTDMKKEKNKMLCREGIDYAGTETGDIRLIVCFDFNKTTLKVAYSKLMNYLKDCPCDEFETRDEWYFNDDLGDAADLEEVLMNQPWED